MTEIWSATITGVGDEAAEMFEGGCYILFGEPVPEALAEVSIVHDTVGSQTDLRPGDRFWIGEDSLTLTEVGNLASTNLTDLGHIVVYANDEAQKLLPGAVKAVGQVTRNPTAGQRMRFTRGD